jgi:phospholipid/cholesterol/gamma-HCH transport system substrate-binding protein
MEISLGLLVLTTLGVLAYIALQMGHLKGLGQSLHAQVVFENASGLVEGAAVKIAGVQVGRVSGLEVDFDKARATLQLNYSAGIRQDALVSIRSRSLLGEKYVEITPRSRTAPLLADGGTLAAAPVGLELDQLITEMGPMLKGLDVEQVGPLLTELKGMVGENRQPVNQAVDRINSLLARLDKVHFDDPAAQKDLKVLIRNLRQTSESLPAMVRDSDRAIADLSRKAGPLLDKVSAAVDRLEPTLSRLPDTVDRLTTTLGHADKVLTTLEPMLARADTIDYDLIKKLLREEGLLIRLKGQDVAWDGAEASSSPSSRPAPPPAPQPPPSPRTSP